MKQLWKRNAVVGTILVFVCAAIFLNGKYAEKVDKPTKVLGQSELVSTDSDAAEVSANAEGKDYFASARLTRQQARGRARSRVKEASGKQGGDAGADVQQGSNIHRLSPSPSVNKGKHACRRILPPCHRMVSSGTRTHPVGTPPVNVT